MAKVLVCFAGLLSCLASVCLPLACARNPGPSLPDAGAARPASPAAIVNTPLGAATPAAKTPAPTQEWVKLDREDSALGTNLHFIAYTNAQVSEASANLAVDQAISEMRRLEQLLSEWRDDSEVGQVNLHAGDWVKIGPESLEMFEQGVKAGKLSQGTFDITFQALSEIWKFGGAQEATPKVPSKAEVLLHRRRVDYRRILIDEQNSRVKIGKDQQVGLGGIAKGFIVDRAVAVLRAAKLNDFLVQAGGDLYGAGKKPDGAPWVSGVQDPRGPQGAFFATIELTDHAFSTAGDYARAYIIAGKRYHHIIDPRTGYPATACRSVTIWAPDALTADAVDDAVFILGPKPGLKLVESLNGVGAVIVDQANRVWVSERLKNKVRISSQPSAGI